MKIQELLKLGYDRLKLKNIETYMLDTQLILGKVINKEKLFIITNRDLEISEDITKEFFRLIKLREEKMPVKYILENAEFMGLNYFVKPGVLIPRPDTEVLVEETLHEIKDKHYKSVCDVCSGSGVIGISLAHYMQELKVVCYDISHIALEVTAINIERFNLGERVQVIKSDLLERAIQDCFSFDVVVSNPPYIKRKVIGELMEDVKNYEPFIALCGGEDGLDFYRKIIEQSKKVLNKNGLVIFEIGYDQKEDVTNLLEVNGFKDVMCIKDLSGNDRVIKAHSNK